MAIHGLSHGFQDFSSRGMVGRDPQIRDMVVNANAGRPRFSSLAERILFKLSYEPSTRFVSSNNVGPTQEWTLESALDLLRGEFPDLDDLIKGKRVLDYGCGDGFQSVALARAGAASVLGVDLDEARLAHGRAMAKDAPNVTFATRVTGQFDVAISLNSMEHFPRPEDNLREIADALAPGGRLLVSFGPPWLAPYGGHMHFFTPVPWVHLLFSERTVFSVRRLYRDDQMSRYDEDMCRMTLKKFEATVPRSGLRLASRRYQAVRRLPLVTRVPGLRELLTNQVVAVLVKEADRNPQAERRPRDEAAASGIPETPSVDRGGARLTGSGPAGRAA